MTLHTGVAEPTHPGWNPEGDLSESNIFVSPPPIGEACQAANGISADAGGQNALHPLRGVTPMPLWDQGHSLWMNPVRCRAMLVAQCWRHRAHLRLGNAKWPHWRPGRCGCRTHRTQARMARVCQARPLGPGSMHWRWQVLRGPSRRQRCALGDGHRAHRSHGRVKSEVAEVCGLGVRGVWPGCPRCVVPEVWPRVNPRWLAAAGTYPRPSSSEPLVHSAAHPASESQPPHGTHWCCRGLCSLCVVGTGPLGSGLTSHQLTLMCRHWN